MHRIDGAGATADNKFTEGDAATGVAATVVTDDWLNSVQEELVTVIEQTGGTLDKAQTNQLWTRLSAWFAKAQTATETLLGQLRVGTQAEVDGGALDDVAVTPKKLRWGFVISLAVNGYVVFPSWLGSWIFQWGQSEAQLINTAGTTSAVVPFNIAFTTQALRVLAVHDGTALPRSAGVTARNNTLTLSGVTIFFENSRTDQSVSAIWVAIGK